MAPGDAPGPEAITGLVLAGGRGRRMGGVDKGLVAFRGAPLALHAARRLAPHVASVAFSANRHIDRYADFGFPVWPDEGADAFAGPLAGFLAGLKHCTTPWLVTVPCDAPAFPLDIVERLARSLRSDPVWPSTREATIGPQVAIARSHGPSGARLQPAFCLMSRSSAAALGLFMEAGGRQIEAWARTQSCAVAEFDDEAAFFNANTAVELADADRQLPR